MWDLIRTGRLNRTGMWHGLSAEDTYAWLSVALYSDEYHRRGKPDAPAGQVFSLDGRHILDLDSFFCALGEAVNGPCGYFGWNLNALSDCVEGRWGATPPFTLQWEYSAKAAWLAERVPTDQGEVSLFDGLLDIFESRGVSVVLR
ncbi:barstar family protein [Streptomyces sp. NPDC088762]|uniref:barstar family protein n=1 Tax=Streptomyces sp. NPDC088762 TaxID=3365891 RepID=UPI00382A3F4E